MKVKRFVAVLGVSTAIGFGALAQEEGLFQAWDANQDQFLTEEEFRAGLDEAGYFRE